MPRAMDAKDDRAGAALTDAAWSDVLIAVDRTYAELIEHLRCECVGAAVQFIHQHNMIAGMRQRKNGSADSGHARTEQNSVLGSL